MPSPTNEHPLSLSSPVGSNFTMETGFSSPRADAFPAGLRVLVVDDDPTWLKILEKMLKKCLYEVTTCGLARDALNLLRERKDGFDIVISDVNMPDMDGFRLLEHVGLEMDLPVIMMSVNGETSRVMKGVQHGACDYLLKPIGMKELKNIWQHVLRKRIHEVRDAEFFEGIESIQMTRTGSDLSDDAYFLFGEDMTSPKKRKDTEIKHDDKEPSDVSSAKKARVVWSVDLHQKFVKAVDQIGYEKVGPKKILDLMNVPWLTRENVASHLQKYRLCLSRLQNESDQKPGDDAVKLSDMSPLDSTGNFGFQNQVINAIHKDVTKGSFEYSSSSQVVQNTGLRSLDSDQKASTEMHVAEPRKALGIGVVPDATKGSFEYSSSSQFVQNMAHRSLDSDRKASIQMHVAEPRRALGIDVPDPRQPRRSCASIECSVVFTSPKLEASYALDSNFAAEYLWRDIASARPKQGNKPSFADGNFSRPQLNGQWQHLPADSIQPAPSIISSSISKTATESGGCLKIRSSDEYGPNANLISSAWSSDNLRPLETTTSVPDRQAKVSVPDYQTVMPSFPDQFQLSMKNQGFDWDCVPEYGSVQKHVNLGVQAFANLDESLPFCLVTGDCFCTNLAVQNQQFPESCHSGMIGEVPVHLFDGLDNDGLYNPAECSLFDQGCL